MSEADGKNPKYWFPAKRYGWGWGLPSRWQGWVVLVTYAALVVGGVPLFRIPKRSLAYGLYVLVLTVVFLAICWRTGEPPRWRWGEDRDRGPS